MEEDCQAGAPEDESVIGKGEEFYTGELAESCF